MAAAVWIYAILGSLLVSERLQGSKEQGVLGGFLAGLGLLGLLLVPDLPLGLLTLLALYLIKLLWAFSADHSR